MLEKHINPTTQIKEVAAELKEAISKGDVTKARAAQSILLNSGGAGLDTLADTLEESVTTTAARNSDVGIGLRNDLNKAGLKGKNNALASWAYAKDKDDNGNNLDASFASVRSQTGTLGSLSSTELGGQRFKALQKAIEANPNAISPEQAQAVLESPEVIKDMDLSKREFFQRIAGGASSAAQGAAQQTTTQTSSPQQPGVRLAGSGLASPDGGLSIPHDTPNTTDSTGSTPTISTPAATNTPEAASATAPIANTATTPEANPVSTPVPNPAAAPEAAQTTPNNPTPTEPAQPITNDQNPSTSGPEYPDDTTNKAP